MKRKVIGYIVLSTLLGLILSWCIHGITEVLNANPVGYSLSLVGTGMLTAYTILGVLVLKSEKLI